MKVLIGVDPHKASVAVAAVDEATGELLDVCWVDWIGDRKWAIVVSPHQGAKDGPI